MLVKPTSMQLKKLSRKDQPTEMNTDYNNGSFNFVCENNLIHTSLSYA
jgi:hypothetical protein